MTPPTAEELAARVFDVVVETTDPGALTGRYLHRVNSAPLFGLPVAAVQLVYAKVDPIGSAPGYWARLVFRGFPRPSPDPDYLLATRGGADFNDLLPAVPPADPD